MLRAFVAEYEFLSGAQHREGMSLARWQRVTHLLLADLHDRKPELGLSPGEVNVLAAFGNEEAVPVGE
jgi:hypothetical protein